MFAEAIRQAHEFFSRQEATWEEHKHYQLARLARKMHNLKMTLGINVGGQKLILPQRFMPGVN